MVTFSVSPRWPLLLLPLLASPSTAQTGQMLDQFNYRETVIDDVHSDFGPEDWGKVQCLDEDCVR